jgi:hypothetical protein
MAAKQVGFVDDPKPVLIADPVDDAKKTNPLSFLYGPHGTENGESVIYGVREEAGNGIRILENGFEGRTVDVSGYGEVDMEGKRIGEVSERLVGIEKFARTTGYLSEKRSAGFGAGNISKDGLAGIRSQAAAGIRYGARSGNVAGHAGKRGDGVVKRHAREVEGTGSGEEALEGIEDGRVVRYDFRRLDPAISSVGVAILEIPARGGIDPGT